MAVHRLSGGGCGRGRHDPQDLCSVFRKRDRTGSGAGLPPRTAPATLRTRTLVCESRAYLRAPPLHMPFPDSEEAR
jgi:hypothetical protein